MLRDTWPRIVAAVTEDRTSVVPAGGDDVDLVAAIGSVLAVPHLAGLGMDDERERVAMAEREKFRTVSGLVHERVVGRNGAVVAQAQDLAAQAGGVLSHLADVAARRHVDHPVASEYHAAVQARIALVGFRHEEIVAAGEG